MSAFKLFSYSVILWVIILIRNRQVSFKEQTDDPSATLTPQFIYSRNVSFSHKRS